MRPEHALEISTLRRDQDRIHQLVRGLDERIDRMDEQLRADPVPPNVVPGSSPAPVPDPLHSVPNEERRKETAVEPIPVPAPPVPSTPPLAVAAAMSGENAATPSSEPPSIFRPPAAPPPTPPALPPPAGDAGGNDRPGAEKEESFEMQLGRVWLVRIGIVVLLTGLVFLGNLAYQHIVPRLGPGGKLSLIGLAGAALCGMGLRLERRGESLRNYARVLLAGGCATIYYTAFAAHFVEPLRVISNPIVGGALLLSLAGGITWIAHRRRSETLALLAVLLSYYTSGLNTIGGFTLFSSLLLTAAAVFFLVHHRWTRLSYVSLLGTYASYAWWHFYASGRASVGLSGSYEVGYLAGYWLLFTAGAFLIRRSAMPGPVRVTFATINNAAFFALAAQTLAVTAPGNFWIFALGFGGVLLGLAFLAARREPEEFALDGAYLVQGLVLTTVGLAAKLSGYQLALVLAAQSVGLLTGRGRQHVIRECAGVVSAAGALLLALDGLSSSQPHAIATAGVVAGILVFDAWWWKRQRGLPDDWHPLATSLTVAGLFLGTTAAWMRVEWPMILPCLAAGTLLCAALPLVLRFRELALGGQGILFVGVVTWIARGDAGVFAPACLLGTGVALAYWWPRQQALRLESETRLGLEGLGAFSAGAVGLVWVSRNCPAQFLMPVTSAIALASVGVALATRARMLTAAGLAFSVLSLIQFAGLLDKTHWFAALAPSASLAGLGLCTRWAHRLGADAAAHASLFRRFATGVAVALLFPWTLHYLPEEWIPLVFAAVGAACALACRREPMLAPAALALGGFAMVWMIYHFPTVPTWQNLAAILVFPAACRVGRKLSANRVLLEAAPAIAWATLFNLTVWCTRAKADYLPELSLTIVWSLLALPFFVTGLVLFDRHYRLGGLALLGLGVARVFFIDVWAFNPVLRIVSFIVLGVVLLLVGYFYNRFAEKLQRWL
jgi:uncharacterized membrane protein